MSDLMCACQQCEWRGPRATLRCQAWEIPNYFRRVAAGEISPAGECPLCGALAHVMLSVSTQSGEHDLSDLNVDDEDAVTAVWVTFAQAVATDDEARHIVDVIVDYQKHPARREYIDRLLIALCGWSLPTLIQQSQEEDHGEIDG